MCGIAAVKAAGMRKMILQLITSWQLRMQTLSGVKDLLTTGLMGHSEKKELVLFMSYNPEEFAFRIFMRFKKI